MWRCEVFISDFDSALCRSIALGGNLHGVINRQINFHHRQYLKSVVCMVTIRAISPW
jgi:hypothetical protein